MEEYAPTPYTAEEKLRMIEAHLRRMPDVHADPTLLDYEDDWSRGYMTCEANTRRTLLDIIAD